MITTFHRLNASDGVELQGLFFTPDQGPSESTIIHVHGLSGNFYENPFVDIVAESVTTTGLNFLAMNNRGHDYISDILFRDPQTGEIGYKRLGGAYERFAESVLDISAYIEFVRSMGSKKNILQGHSHGALKVTQYLFKEKPDDIEGLILLSPSDDFGIARSRVGDRFESIFQNALSMIEKGRGDEMIPTEDFVYPITAGAYVDTFRDDSPLKMFNLSETDTDRFPELESVKVPVLAILGDVEESFPDTPGDYLSKMNAAMIDCTDFTGHVINGAPHNYLQKEMELAGHISSWLTGFIK